MTFFRRIRQQLFSENKPASPTGRYTKYAIGEILLVVIGILIALQINNWNEAKKSRAYEVKMLREVHKALENDIVDFKRNITRMEILDSSIGVFVHLVNRKEVFIDSLYTKGISRWYYLRTGAIYLNNRGPYDAIKSSGLDKISSDDLRNSLINYYDFELPGRDLFNTWVGRKYDDNVEKLISFLDPPFIEIVNDKETILRKFPENLFENPDFLILLMDMRERAQLTKLTFTRQISEMEKILGLIHSEISI